MEQNTQKEEKVEYPIIQADDEKIVITITKDILINAIEGRPDSQYKVVEPDKLLERFAYYLANYAESNAVETGLNELQYLFDRVADELYTSGEDVIIDLNEDLYL